MNIFMVSIYFCRVSVGLTSAFWSTDHLSILIVPVSTRWLHFYLLCPSAVDEEAFEDNAEEYIRRDIEGSGDHFTHSIHPEIPFADKLLISLTRLPCFILIIKFDIGPSFSKDHCVQMWTLAAVRPATLCAACVASSRVLSRRYFRFTWLQCSRSMPKNLRVRGSTKTPPSSWLHRSPPKHKHTR